MHQLLATICVDSSLALGGSDPTSGFRLQTLSFDRPLGNRGARLGYNFHIPCSHSRRDVRVVGEACKLGLSSPLLRLRGPNRFSSSVMTP
jgi:hypothetical protein